MFKHHKYCVVETTGLLVGYVDLYGRLNVFVFDWDNALKATLLDRAAKNAPDLEAQLSGYCGGKIKITDPALLDFIEQTLPPTGYGCLRYLQDVRITGSVNMIDDEVHFAEVSQATLDDNGNLRCYKPAGQKNPPAVGVENR